MKLTTLLCLISFSLFADSFSSKVRPFLDKHCYSCHGEKKQKGKLRLDNLSTDFNDLDIAEQWQFVLDELNGATMPPEDEPQPSKQELTEILEVLTYKIEEAKKIHYGKDRQTVMRRLNKREYINTMYELTGFKFQDEEIIEDQSTAKYDNHGEGLFVSSFLLGKYRQYAYNALDKALSNEKPKAISFQKSPASEYNETLRKKMSEIKKRLISKKQIIKKEHSTSGLSMTITKAILIKKRQVKAF